MSEETEDQRAATGFGANHPRSGRLLQALPAVAFLGSFGIFFVDKNREARTVLKSGRGLFTVCVVIVGYLGVGLVLRRFSRWAALTPLVLTVVVLGLATWIVRPYYVDEEVDRRLVTGPVQDASQVTAPSVGATEPPPSAAAAPGPVRISSGPIRGIGHDATGTISIVRIADGSLVVRFEDFDIEGTPDPRVHLVRGNDVRAPGGIDLGHLQGNVGKVFDYAVANPDAGPGWTVLVWCRSFSVPIANSTQTAT